MSTPKANRASATADALNRAVLGWSVAAAAVYVVVALLRLRYPFELEWIEGGSLQQVRRVLAGQPIYAAPTLEYIPFNYTPLYYVVSAWAARLFGDGFAALRLVSFASSLAGAALIFAIVRRAVGRAAPAVIAAGLFFAAYRFAGGWLDVARSDSLHLALLLGAGAALVLDPHPIRSGVTAGALVALSFLAKQSAVVAAGPIAVALLLADRPRGLAFTATTAALIAGSTLLLDAQTHGWYRYYVFALAGRYSADPALLGEFWTNDLAGRLGIALAGGLLAFVVAPASWLAASRATLAGFVAGLVLSSAAVRAYPAAFDNVLLPACAAMAITFGLGLHVAQRLIDESPSERRHALAIALPIAALIQFSLLLYDPRTQLPRANDAALGERLVEGLRQAPGSVLAPCHPELTERAGKGTHFHEMAFMAVAKSGTGAVERGLFEEFRKDLQQHRWQTIVLDKGDWLWDEVACCYAPTVPVFEHDQDFWPVTGMRRRPEVIFVPRADSTGAR
jgi:hypothetical protein